jgi:hypothetical protein
VENKNTFLILARDLQLPEPTGKENIDLNWLAYHLNEILQSDFNRLINILYRADISEDLLRRELERNPETDAGLIIAGLLLQRQEQKIKSRKDQPPGNDECNEERW